MSEFISVNDGATMTTSYRESRSGILAAGVPVDVLPICETFAKADIQTLLDHQDCESLRIYPGRDQDGKIIFVLVGVNGNDEDILDNDYAVLDRAKRCPYICPPSSPLNS